MHQDLIFWRLYICRFIERDADREQAVVTLQSGPMMPLQRLSKSHAFNPKSYLIPFQL